MKKEFAATEVNRRICSAGAESEPGVINTPVHRRVGAQLVQSQQFQLLSPPRRASRPARFLALFVALAVSAFCAEPPNFGKGFPSPDSAFDALAAAVKARSRDALHEILGPACEDLQMTDQVQRDEELARFAAAYQDAHQVVRDSDGRATLVIGTNDWPFPVPLVRTNGQWFFDTDAGKEEIINRRVGRNELSALSVARAYVDAQREYASKDHNGDEVLEYAQSILSAPGQKDGLYWSPELDGEISPLGPLVAAAQGEGYMNGSGEKSGPRPYHGYCFKVLTRQGRHAPGGKYGYIINGHMIGGFALVAWPADYGVSGIMTFIVNQQGKAYQKDLGPKTEAIAKAMKEYNPDSTWTVSPD